MNSLPVDLLAVMARCSTTLTALSVGQPADGELAALGHDLVTARVIASELLATVREFAAACAECHGTGQLLYRSSDDAVGDPCPGCDDLRALISRAS